MQNFLGPQIESDISVFAVFSRLILHKIAAWENVQHLVELKPPKIMLWPKVGLKKIFYSNVIECPLKLACLWLCFL